jgi:RNA polymerase sigma-70 factor (ECF subfamily)
VVDAAQAFLEALAPAVRAGLDADALPESWRERWQAAQARWPGLAVDATAFAAYAAARVTSAQDWQTQATFDLYLAFACRQGDARAVRLFDGGPLGVELERVRRRFGPETGDEVGQIVRARLFQPREDGRLGIETYSGRGDLRGWLRVALTREAVHQQRPAFKQAAVSPSALANAVDDADPELQLIKATYREPFRQSLAAAMSALTRRDQELLRASFIERLNVDEIGALHRVHRATAARWVADARKKLLDGTRDEIMRRLGISTAEADSILRLADSKLEITLSRLFPAAD